jgi:hypothetical protein
MTLNPLEVVTTWTEAKLSAHRPGLSQMNAVLTVHLFVLVFQRKSSALLRKLIAERHRFEQRGLEMQTAEVGV